MATSFYPADSSGRYTGTIQYRREVCLCTQMLPDFGSYLDRELTEADEEVLLAEANPSCAWCKGYGVAREPFYPQELSLGSHTAHAVMQLLGLSGYSGQVAIDKVRVAFDKARKGLDEAMLKHETAAFSKGNYVHLGVNAERLIERFEALQGLVDLCPPGTTHLVWN